MRTILIGTIHERFKTLYIEQAYTRNGFSESESDCDLRYLGAVDHGLSGEPGFTAYGMKGERLSFKNRDSLNIDYYCGKKVAVLFDAWTDLTHEKKCFYLKEGTGEILSLQAGVNPSIIRRFNEYLAGDFRISMGSGTVVNSISGYIQNACQMAQNEITADVIRAMNFEGNHYPQPDMYEHKGGQGYYLCKFAYAYTYMYYECYQKVLDQLEAGSTLKVLSLGCGAKLDGLGLALASYYNGHIPFTYKGVDYSDWKKHGFDISISHSDFHLGSIDDYLDNIDQFDVNTVIFPYSISELKSEKGMLENIADNLSRLAGDSLFLIFNIRENRDSAEIDIRSIDERLIPRMNRNLQDREIRLLQDVDYSTEENAEDIYEIMPNYPINVRRFLQQIPDIECIPMLRKKYIHYRIYKLYCLTV